MNRQHPRRLLVLLSAATLIPILTLTFLGVRLVRQESEAEGRRRADALEVEAGRIALEIEGRFREVEAHLATGQGLRLTDAGVARESSSAVLYQPMVEPVVEQTPASFAAAEAAEALQQNLAAAAEYRRLSTVSGLNGRALALLGLGRVLRKLEDAPGALRAYADLEALDAERVTGVPANLLAKYARLRLFQRGKEGAAVKAAAVDLGRALNSGGWLIDRATFFEYSDAAVRLGGPPPSPEAIGKSDAILSVWHSWQTSASSAVGRRSIPTAGGSITVVASATGDGLTAWLATSRELERWLAPAWSDRDVSVSAADISGPLIFGPERREGVTLAPGQTRLPFVLSVAAGDGFTADVGGPFRRTILAVILAGAFGLMLAAAVGIYRATTREFRLAQQQTDFVSAVSHEFRTPLTSMRHLLDLLTTRGVTDEGRRTHYYGHLTNETDRLHRMVESLLSFGRMEAGTYAWKRESLDAAKVAQAVVEDFRRDELALTREVGVVCDADLPAVLGDADALTLAMRNLLENAAKYSPPSSPVSVHVGREYGAVRVSVTDRGVGIPAGELTQVFNKFVRGAEAKRSGVRGVGIGLALVKEIAEAHGGTVSAESLPGAGSTFTISLPSCRAAVVEPSALVARDASP